MIFSNLLQPSFLLTLYSSVVVRTVAFCMRDQLQSFQALSLLSYARRALIIHSLHLLHNSYQDFARGRCTRGTSCRFRYNCVHLQSFYIYFVLILFPVMTPRGLALSHPQPLVPQPSPLLFVPRYSLSSYLHMCCSPIIPLAHHARVKYQQLLVASAV